MNKNKNCSCGGEIIKDNEAPWFVPDMSYSCSNKKCKKRFCIFCKEEINKKIEVVSHYFNNYSAENKTEHMTANPCSKCGVLHRQWGQLLVVSYKFVFGFPPCPPIYLLRGSKNDIYS